MGDPAGSTRAHLAGLAKPHVIRTSQPLEECECRPSG
jgi:hypothetical protein